MTVVIRENEITWEKPSWEIFRSLGKAMPVFFSSPTLLPWTKSDLNNQPFSCPVNEAFQGQLEFWIERVRVEWERIHNHLHESSLGLPATPHSPFTASVPLNAWTWSPSTKCRWYITHRHIIRNGKRHPENCLTHCKWEGRPLLIRELPSVTSPLKAVCYLSLLISPLRSHIAITFCLAIHDQVLKCR